MTPEDARKLKIDDRVIWRGSVLLSGKVEWNGRSLCSVVWQDGTRTTMNHAQLDRMERVPDEPKPKPS